MKIHAIKCLNKKCGDIIYSRAEWDFLRCSCGKVPIDGGFTVYGGRMLGNLGDYVEVTLDLPVSEKELYDDLE